MVWIDGANTPLVNNSFYQAFTARSGSRAICGDEFGLLIGDRGPLAATGKLDHLVGPGEMRNGLLLAGRNG